MLPGSGDDPDQEVEYDPVALLQPGSEGLRADAGDPQLAIGLVREPVVQVVGQLAVDADRLQLVQDRFA